MDVLPAKTRSARWPNPSRCVIQASFSVCDEIAAALSWCTSAGVRLTMVQHQLRALRRFASIQQYASSNTKHDNTKTLLMNQFVRQIVHCGADRNTTNFVTMIAISAR